VTSAAYVPLNTRPYGGHERLLSLAGSPARALDIGCSSGYLARRLVERGATVVGIDVDEHAVAEAREI
jgi:ribosomal protein L11 methylase PrmA